ncbi:MAG: divalent-cation tolerance protein CutA [Proteobacteria bacterium]|nr:divalent-cation tolerance protein CutA [Pseudomonadota bacterium]MBU1585374.1 divalent-cation tolerance protein CutA [Pseudomonadota bacterium]MBU2455170.1 divalent-cation tolerance protein CutA [Pseudomonadota bacterium]MBU2631580.1 divalent-cation tolerance protein CutA [Pseudomonadota bacterium]
MEYCIILTTCPNDKEAEMLASSLIEKKLAACVQMEPITSYYTWENALHIETELKLTIKTRTRLYESVEKFIKENHSYEVPQILQIPIVDGLDEYLDWIDENTTE